MEEDGLKDWKNKRMKLKYSNNRLISFIIIMVVTIVVSCKSSFTKNFQKSNFIFILVDDLGWTDLGCYGSSFYVTPYIDKLAGESTKFGLYKVTRSQICKV